MAAIVDDKNWRKFFETYKSLPEIWEVKHEAYKNREKRNIGWQKLLQVYQTIDSEATMEKLKHRINNIRSCYRRELKKIQLSEKLGPDGVHVPILWYYGLMDFIKDQEILSKPRWRDSCYLLDDIDDIELSDNELEEPEPLPKRLKLKKRKMPQITNIEDNDENHVDYDVRPENRAVHDISKVKKRKMPQITNIEDNYEHHVDYDVRQEKRAVHDKSKVKKRKMPQITNIEDNDENYDYDVLRPEKRATHDISKDEASIYAISKDDASVYEIYKDEASIYADGWACSYRKLTVEQQLYAKKAIEEVLILGQLNALNLETVDASSLKVISRPEFEQVYDPDDQVYNDEIDD